MATRTTWLDEGLAVLAESGVDGLRIDRLADRLGLSKGSFYHHFTGMPAYRSALLEHFETSHTSSLIDQADAAGPGAAERLDRLQRLVIRSHGHDGGIEVAVRAWAGRDAEAQAMMARVDATRLRYLERQWRELTDRTTARRTARLIYLTLIGAQHLAAPVSRRELDRLLTAVTRSAMTPDS